MIRLEVWGPYAAFNRPELKVERYSYDFITPSAARNILQAVYWHPSFDWVVDKIYILNPIERFSITKNEQIKKGSYSEMLEAALGLRKPPHLKIDQTQRSSNVLKNVHYIIEAHFVSSGKEGFDQDKIYAIFTQRAASGKCFTTPYLGIREFTASFGLYPNDCEIKTADITKDCGIMLMDIDYSKNPVEPYYFKAKIENGVVNLAESEVYK